MTGRLYGKTLVANNLSRFSLAEISPAERSKLLLRAEADLSGYLDKVWPIIEAVRLR
jgi:hypothetical protein